MTCSEAESAGGFTLLVLLVCTHLDPHYISPSPSVSLQSDFTVDECRCPFEAVKCPRVNIVFRCTSLARMCRFLSVPSVLQYLSVLKSIYLDILMCRDEYHRAGCKEIKPAPIKRRQMFILSFLNTNLLCLLRPFQQTTVTLSHEVSKQHKLD